MYWRLLFVSKWSSPLNWLRATGDRSLQWKLNRNPKPARVIHVLITHSKCLQHKILHQINTPTVWEKLKNMFPTCSPRTQEHMIYYTSWIFRLRLQIIPLPEMCMQSESLQITPRFFSFDDQNDSLTVWQFNFVFVTPLILIVNTFNTLTSYTHAYVSQHVDANSIKNHVRWSYRIVTHCRR